MADGIFSRLVPGMSIAPGEALVWSHTEADGVTGARAQAALDEEGVLRLDVVEWTDQGREVVLALEISEEGKVLDIAGVPEDSEAPLTEFASRFRTAIAAMQLVA